MTASEIGMAAKVKWYTLTSHWRVQVKDVSLWHVKLEDS